LLKKKKAHALFRLVSVHGNWAGKESGCFHPGTKKKPSTLRACLVASGHRKDENGEGKREREGAVPWCVKKKKGGESAPHLCPEALF